MRFYPGIGTVLVLLGLWVPTHAFATGGIYCSSPEGDIRLTAVLSRGIAPMVVAVDLSAPELGHRAENLVVVQSWIDKTEIRLDLADAEFTTIVARLRVPRAGLPVPDHGSLRIGDLLYAVSCEVDG